MLPRFSTRPTSEEAETTGRPAGWRWMAPGTSTSPATPAPLTSPRPHGHSRPRWLDSWTPSSRRSTSAMLTLVSRWPGTAHQLPSATVRGRPSQPPAGPPDRARLDPRREGGGGGPTASSTSLTDPSGSERETLLTLLSRVLEAHDDAPAAGGRGCIGGLLVRYGSVSEKESEHLKSRAARSARQGGCEGRAARHADQDRKSTRLNSSHSQIS